MSDDARRAQQGDVLVVEDDHVTRLMVAQFLTDEGYAVREAANGVEALMALYERQPAVMLLDLSMPQLSGRELIAELRATGMDVPTIVISALPALAAECAEQYQVRTLAKPFNLDVLLTCIAQYGVPRQDQSVAH